MNELVSQFGEIDIYLFDQLLRGRIPPGATVLDAGAGGAAISCICCATATTCGRSMPILPPSLRCAR